MSTTLSKPSAAHALASLPRPQAILFDWDNTLAHTWEAIKIAMNAALKACGKPEWTSAEVLQGMRYALAESFPRIFGDDWQRAREIYYSVFTAHQMDNLGIMPGAPELLAWLSAQKIWLGVVSNKRGQFLREEVEKLGWARHFKIVIGADDAEAPKPSSAPVHFALGRGGAPIAAGPEVWFVGDGESDIACAIAAECTPILIASAVIPDNADHAAARFANLHDLLAALKARLS